MLAVLNRARMVLLYGVFVVIAFAYLVTGNMLGRLVGVALLTVLLVIAFRVVRKRFANRDAEHAEHS